MFKIFKKVGKFVKRGLKKVGSFFKRAFKKVGKFMGKLGPVGMLGMMLIMPQLGSWWSQFGEWAGTLKGPFKFGMKAIHEAGSLVGKAYSTVTEGIDSIIGGFADTVGLGDHYKDFKSWMDTKLEDTREAFGLKTQDQLALERTGFEKPDIDLDKGKIDLKANEATVVEKLERNILDKASSYEKFDPTRGEVTVQTQQQMADESLYGFDSDPSKLTNKGSGIDTTTTDDKSLFDKVVDKGKKAYGGYESVTKIAEKLGYGEEEYDPYYGAFIADNYVPMYESAQFDWTQQGYAGMPAYGIGNSNYLQSISNAFGTDPYYQWIAQQQQPRSA
tara:strand:+ start:2870 stop:3862 length:993 start_codon:yes stop_codon:yes gene_type:complete